MNGETQVAKPFTRQNIVNKEKVCTECSALRGTSVPTLPHPGLTKAQGRNATEAEADRTRVPEDGEECMKRCYSFRELAQDPLKSKLTKPVHIPTGRINRDSVGYKKRERRGEGGHVGDTRGKRDEEGRGSGEI